MTTSCPVCAEKVILPAKGSSILWLASHPNEEEKRYGRLISGESGDITRREFLQSTKVDPLTFSRASLWLHDEVKNKKGKDCLAIGVDTVLPILKDKTFVILVGAGAVKYFTGLSVSDVSGLEVTELCKFELFPEAKHIFAMMNPGIAMGKGKGIGEIRFAIENMKEFLHER